MKWNNEPCKSLEQNCPKVFQTKWPAGSKDLHWACTYHIEGTIKRKLEHSKSVGHTGSDNVGIR